VIHLERLRAIHPDAVVLAVFAFDADNAGRGAASRVWDLLSDVEAGTAGALVLPEGADPAQLVQDGHWHALAERLAQPTSLASVVVDAELARHDLTIPEGRVAGLRAAAARVAGIPQAPLARVGAHLHARLAPHTDLGTIAGRARHRARGPGARGRVMSTCGTARLASTPTGEGHMSISDEERARRADDAARIRHSTELEGGRTSEAARAIRMAVDLRRDPATRKGALARVGQQLGINPETLRNWVTQAEVDAGARPGTTTAEQARITELEREVRELRRANEILRTASTFFAAAELDRKIR
jgi:transposase-like protein